MSEETAGKATKLIIVLVLIVVLYIAIIQPLIAKYYPLLKSFGEEESTGLTDLKESCEANQVERCALNVAIGTLGEGESPIIAESWLRKEIKFSDSQSVLKDCLDFAKKLYAQSNDWAGAIETYDLLYEKLHTEDVLIAQADARTGIEIQNIAYLYGGLKSFQDPSSGLNSFDIFSKNKEQIKEDLFDMLILYKKYPGKIADKQIIDKNGKICNFFSITDSISPTDEVNKFIICTQFSRASIKYGCYHVPGSYGGTCLSCANFKGDCTNYGDSYSCETDPCDVGDCKWDGTSRTCIVLPGTKNYWDVR